MTRRSLRAWQNAGKLALTACLLLPVFAYAYLGLFNRMMADDYCGAAYAKIAGVLGGTVIIYLGYSGRFASAIVGTILGSFGGNAPPVVPVLVLAVWLGVLIVVITQFNLASNRLTRLFASLLIASGILTTTLAVSPLAGESLIWVQSMSSYIPPLILATVYAGLVMYYLQQPPPTHKTYRYLWGFFLAFFSGGFNEIFVTLQTCLFALLLLGDFVQQRFGKVHRTLAWYLAGFLGSFTALIVEFIAPGNHVRQSQFPHAPGMLALIRITLESWLAFWAKTLTSPVILVGLISLLALAIAAGAGLLFDSLPQPISLRSARYALIWLPLGMAFLLAACFAPSAYGESGAPPERTLVMPYYFLMCSLAAWGYLAGQLLKQGYLARSSTRSQHLPAILLGGCLCLSVLSPLWAAGLIIQQQPAISHFSAQWDTANRIILNARSQGLSTVTIPHVTNWLGIDDLNADPNFWVNRCAKIYYGITIQTQ